MTTGICVRSPKIDTLWRHAVTRDGATTTVMLSGELDMSGRDDLIDLLVGEVSRSGVTRVTADLHEVDFIDSSAVYAFLTAYQNAQHHNVAFTVARAHGHVEAVLTITGVLTILAPATDRNSHRAVLGASDDSRQSI